MGRKILYCLLLSVGLTVYGKDKVELPKPPPIQQVIHKKSPADIQISEAPIYDYGSVSKGNSLDHLFILKNVGEKSARHFSFSSLASPFSYLQNNCNLRRLKSGETCSVTIRFAPTQSGSYSALMEMQYRTRGDWKTTQLTVKGRLTSSALLVLSDSPAYDFGIRKMGTSSEHTFILSNQGQETATQIQSSLMNDAFSFTGGNCGSSLAAGAQCQARVSFQPTVAGSLSGNLKVAYFNGTADSSVALALSGMGRNPVQLSFTVSSYSFDSVLVNHSAEMTFTLVNHNESEATQLRAVVGGFFSIRSNSCGDNLAGQNACSLVVAFEPRTSSTQQSALTVHYNDGEETRETAVQLTGVGKNPAQLVFAQATPYSFGHQLPGSQISRIVTVINIGEWPATSMELGMLNSPFSRSNQDCTAQLNAGSSCSVNLLFAPTSTGSFQAPFVVPYFDGNGNSSATLQLQGKGAYPAVIESNNGSSYDFGSLKIGDRKSMAFTFLNSGGMAATDIGLSSMSHGFSFSEENCVPSIGENTYCSITLSFSPEVEGSSSAIFYFNYFDGYQNKAVSIQLSGSGVSSGQLDPTYDSDGRMTTLFPASTVSTAMAVQNDGKILMVGYLLNDDVYRVVLARFLPDGSQDMGFGEQGSKVSGFGNIDDRANAIALQNDGKIVIAGHSYSGANKNILVARYLSNGHIDNSFHGTGSYRLDIAGGEDQLLGVSVQSDGKIVVAGSSKDANGEDFLLARFSINGELDTTFNSSGIALFDFGGNDRAKALAIGNQQIWAVGYSNNEVAILQVNGMGDDARTFVLHVGDGNSFASAALPTSDGSVMVGGTAMRGSQKQFAVMKISQNGELDPAFGEQGIGWSDFNSNATLTALQTQSDGKIVAAGFSSLGNSGNQFALFRMLPSGMYDNSFGGRGKVLTSIRPNNDDRIQGMQIQSDGKIVTTGFSSDGSWAQMASARYTH